LKLDWDALEREGEREVAKVEPDMGLPLFLLWLYPEDEYVELARLFWL